MAESNPPSIEANHCTEFMRDLITHALECLGYQWESKDQTDFRSSKRRKTDEKKVTPAINQGFCDAVLRLRYKLHPKFGVQLQEVGGSIFESYRNFERFIHINAQNYFEGTDFMRGFITYSAFVVNLAAYCYEKELSGYVDAIVNATEGVYEAHMKNEFEKFGFRSSTVD